ncbi:hypothetical protein BHU72_07240 [Desulfuribacillus stibiiarsenatis]|uniref:ABC transmembrane type-1 domain-containing protein n=1 Tax=Desulfuribacillus stibiiarsenatis TaxID=1390249 RepID=A0A1E5L4C8_9FIRM|nr:ABC transporter permease subunit [Desulfuribacillus stibiiarsenatis]OEH84977.1 hypothetical protein BHU72_07240 [Desulfuribacillus stibiiarsenatis]
MGTGKGNTVWRLFILLIIAVPFYPLIIWSVASGWQWPKLVPNEVQWRAWQYVFSSGDVWQSIGLTMWIAVVVLVINLLLAIPSGRALAFYDFKGKGFVELILIMPIMIPPYAIMMGLQLLFLRAGITDQMIGVIIAHIFPTLPYMVRALTISYSAAGREWEEVASVLGASKRQTFTAVTIPYLLPGIIAGSFLVVIISISQYIITMIIGGGQVVTLPLLLVPFILGDNPVIAAAYNSLFAFLAIGIMILMEVFLKLYYRNRQEFAVK